MFRFTSARPRYVPPCGNPWAWCHTISGCMSPMTPSRSCLEKASYERLTMSTLFMHVGYAAMKYAMDARADGTVFETEPLTQRVGPLAGEHHETGADEVVYVLEGTGRVTVGCETHEVRQGVSVFVSRGTPWSAEGDARVVSVLIHEPEPSTGHAVLDLNAMETGTATAGRQFLLGATPEVGCASVTQFVGLVPPGRAPDHFHTYDEVIYVLEGEGLLEID